MSILIGQKFHLAFLGIFVKHEHNTWSIERIQSLFDSILVCSTLFAIHEIRTELLCNKTRYSGFTFLMSWENLLFEHANPVHSTADQCLWFSLEIVPSFYCLDWECWASHHLLWLSNRVCVRPSLKPWRPVSIYYWL